jgi:hypothetical protein
MRINDLCGAFCERFAGLSLAVIFFFFISSRLSGQVHIPPPPQRPIVVNSTSQGLSFGTFYHGSTGGTITVTPAGARTSTGSIVPILSGTYTPALFEVAGNPGTVVTILNGSDVYLAGSNGGSLKLTVGASLPESPFILSLPNPQKTQLYIGGTLTIGNTSANPPGSYSGTFVIIFNQQ